MKTFVFSNVLPRFYGSGTLKFWKENTYEPCPVIFDISNCLGFYMNGVNTKAPDEVILTKDPLTYQLFESTLQSTNDINTAPVVALLNNESDFGLGTVNFSGMQTPDELLALPAYGFIYQENFNVKGISLMNFNANRSGGGVYWGTQNCKMTTGNQTQYFINEVDLNVQLNTDKSAFNLPKDIDTLVIHSDKDNAVWCEREAYTSRSSIIQINGKDDDVFTFILPNKLMIQTYLMQINGHSADSNIVHEQGSKKLLAGLIPNVGDEIVLQREYETNLSYKEMKDQYMIADVNDLNYNVNAHNQPPGFRSHQCHTTLQDVYGNRLSGVFEGDYYLQAGDELINKTTGTVHEIVELPRGFYDNGYQSNQSGYCMEYKPFANDNECLANGFGKKPDVFVYQNYILDPPLPIPEISNKENCVVRFEVKKSRARYLLDGGTYPAKMKWMSNTFWNLTENETIAASNSAKAHSFYNQRELNHDHRESDFSGTYYRENNMNYNGFKFTLDNGESVRSIAAYPFFGAQHVNTTVPAGQYGDGYDKYMPQREAIIQDQNIKEDYMCMQRNIGEVNQPQKVANPFYTTTETRPRPKRLTDFLQANKND